MSFLANINNNRVVVVGGTENDEDSQRRKGFDGNDDDNRDCFPRAFRRIEVCESTNPFFCNLELLQRKIRRPHMKSRLQTGCSISLSLTFCVLMISLGWIVVQ